jgi:hypothetical protein
MGVREIMEYFIKRFKPAASDRIYWGIFRSSEVTQYWDLSRLHPMPKIVLVACRSNYASARDDYYYFKNSGMWPFPYDDFWTFVKEDE